jgi:hypothetical protein
MPACHPRPPIACSSRDRLQTQFSQNLLADETEFVIELDEHDLAGELPYVCARSCARVHACARVRVCARVRACARARVQAAAYLACWALRRLPRRSERRGAAGAGGASPPTVLPLRHSVRVQAALERNCESGKLVITLSRRCTVRSTAAMSARHSPCCARLIGTTVRREHLNPSDSA